MRFVTILLLLLALAAGALAQTTGAAMEGTIKAPTGALLAGTSLQLRNTKTGATWLLTTDGAGRFRAPLLPPGEYDLSVSAEDFMRAGEAILEGIQLTVGDDARINLAVSLEPGTPKGQFVARINLTSGALSGLVDDKVIRDLPLNGRSFQQLALLQAGVTASRFSGTDVIGGRMPKITINGARPEMNSFLLDGTDINDVYDKTPGSTAGVLLGVEAVREFRVMINSYSAEFGRAAGGVVNAITRSGENDFHGSVFEFLRNSKLDARNFFDPAGSPVPPFKRNQFGAAAGGRIRRDRTFFFATFESLVERLGITGVTAVPDANARQGVLPNKTVRLNPSIPGYLALFPFPNGAPLGGGVAQYLYSRSQPTAEHLLQGRVDHRISDRDILFGRYTIGTGQVERQPVNKPPLAHTDEQTRNQYATLEHQHSFSPATVNTARLGFNRSVQEADNQRTVDIPQSLSFVPGEPFGFFSITGVVNEMGGDWRLPRLDHLNNYQWEDNLLAVRGRSTWKVGFKGQRIQYNTHYFTQRGGFVTFTNLENFLQGIVLNADIGLPALVDPDRGLRQSLWGLYAQNDLRLKPNFTINVGMRYEFTTVPTEQHNRIGNLRQITDPAVTVGSPWYSNPSLGNLAPRVGLAWDPFKDGKTAIRAGFGMFYDPILSKYLFLPASVSPPFTQRVSIPNAPFPNIVANYNPRAPLRPSLHAINFELQSPYLLHFNLAVSRSLPGGWDVTAAYAGSRGVHLFRGGDANLSPETLQNGNKIYQPQLGRRNPAFSAVVNRATDARSYYNSLQLTAAKRFSGGLRAQAAYTLSRTIDDAAGSYSQDFNNTPSFGLDFYDRRIDRGLSPFHATHNLTFNWTYSIPALPQGPAWGRAALRGWQMHSITTLQSGHPFTVLMGFNRSGNLNTGITANERPNVKPGYTGNPVLGGPDRYWDINAFELPPANQRGNLGRNALIGPGLASLDLSLTRSFRIKEAWNLQFRAEAFNLPNHPNVAEPSGRTTFTNAAGAVAPNWGRITATTSTSRQIQFGLKLSF
jgi:hypothetical protein